MKHASRPIELKIHTVMDGTPILTRWLELTNTSEQALPMSSITPFSGRLWKIFWQNQQFPERLKAPYSVGYFRHDDWGQEGDFGWVPVEPAGFSIKGRKGKSGWGNPFFIARNEANGEYFACELGWSGEWSIDFQREVYGRDKDMESLLLRVGPYAVDAVMRLIAPHEKITTPAVHIGIMTGDLDDVVQAMHRHVRKSVLPPQPAGAAYLIQDNHWGYQSGIEDEAGIKGVIDTAAAAGAELFIFDAGWYGKKRNDWGAQVGDWHPGPWLPNGLKPMVDYAHAKGVKFGLWMEAESLGGHTAFYREHPEFLARRDGKLAYDRRGLDMANPKVAAWVEAEMARVISEYKIDLFRLDYNVTDRKGGANHVIEGYTENTQWRHYEAFYAILERLRKRFPNVILENCAGGGGRTDLGILRSMHTTWVSDVSNLPKGLKILNGMTMLLPPEIITRTFGTQWDDQRQYGDLETQLRVTLFAHPSAIGIAPSLADTNPVYLAAIRHAFTLYKEFMRPMLAQCRVYHHTPVLPFAEAGDWAVLEYASADSSRAYAGLFRQSAAGNPEYCFKPRGLKASRRYRVRFDNRGDSAVRSGFDLMQSGLTVRIENGIRSELLLFDEVK
ncbi:MAG: alpha-galactosidase [Acidobacteria bacterium]|nr:alpha-galactosidase [Acidobacteriota bacterium]